MSDLSSFVHKGAISRGRHLHPTLGNLKQKSMINISVKTTG